jgi:UDP-N-acetylglucosamine--N-acetylmuramyl-(pentapeptide) pyrophosphoryl-undecaprenol N-acetylglucosamine transferase
MVVPRLELASLRESAAGDLGLTVQDWVDGENPGELVALAALMGARAPLDAVRRAIMALAGGSQGARAFSEIVPAALTRLPHDLKLRLSVVQQCRAEDLEAVKTIYANAEIRADLRPFFNDLPQRMAEAHLVIGRSGAGTVAELMAIGRPAILVPLPTAMDDHQTDNAAILSRAGAGWLVAQKTLTAESLAELLLQLFRDPAQLAARAEAAHKLAIPHAAENLADMVEQLANSSASRKAA